MYLENYFSYNFISSNRREMVAGSVALKYGEPVLQGGLGFK